MICRIWHGWATGADAVAYEKVVREQVIPGIEQMKIEGFRHIDLLKRNTGREIEFMTLMWFDNLEAIRDFVGEDVTLSHVPPAARALLGRFDARAEHFDVVDRREQNSADSR